MASRSCDLLVIGAGPGGYVAAIRAGQLGKRVVLVERDRLGGECLNYGCIPSKALIHVASLKHKLEKAGEMGLTASGLTVDMAKLQAWKSGVVEKLTGGIATLCKGNNVEVVFGEARFTGPHSVAVKTHDGEEAFEAANVIVAVGGRPVDLPAFRFDRTRVLSTKESLELTAVPKELLVIGGGVSGLEMGTFYAKLGSRVTVVELLDRLLPGVPGVDDDVVRVLLRSLKKLGMVVHVKSQAKALELRGDKLLVKGETPDGPIEVLCDKVLVAVGRKANTDDLGLSAVGVTTDNRGHIPTDHQMRSNVPHVLAIGDVRGPPYLAHKASREGIVAAEVACGLPSAFDNKAMPAAIFTDPEIATVGLTEEEATGKGLQVKVGKVPFAAIGRTLTAGELDGFAKLVTDAANGRILGAQVVGPEASNVISELSLAIEMGATAEDIALTIHPHPTFPEGILEAAEAALGRAIHVLNK
ncbi:MAG TPA: dihydrolipoyl dehydrogenase [Thermoplasmata archaeon]|nr:dihydrolipoyl dehydrogenase [Thermoplasmata archaeon]